MPKAQTKKCYISKFLAFIKIFIKDIGDSGYNSYNGAYYNHSYYYDHYLSFQL